MDVSVIIVNYNTCALLDNCLESIKFHTQDIQYEVIVVDNASSDGSIEMVTQKHPWVKLIESKINLGFGKANNLGFEYSSGKNIFLLNSDTILVENSIKTLSRELDKDDSIGAVGGILIGPDHNQVHSYGKFPSILKKLLGINFVISNVNSTKPLSVDYITGADLMIPRPVWRKTGGFDPNFFLYYEETDLQKRIASLGYNRVIIPYTNIIHLEGESTKSKSGTINEWKNITMFKSMIYYMKKHSSSLSFKALIHLLRIKYTYLIWTNSDRQDYYNKLIDCLKS